jgi:hypothetical protein
MARSTWVAGVCGFVILGACSRPSEEMEPTVSTEVQVTMDYSGCDGYGFGTSDTPVILPVKAATVTKSCRCEYRTTAGQTTGCGHGEVCMDDDESPGGKNPISCEVLKSVPEAVQVTATLDDAALCSLVLRPIDASQSDLVVSCKKVGFVRVDMTAVVGGTTNKRSRAVEFRAGACPPR